MRRKSGGHGLKISSKRCSPPTHTYVHFLFSLSRFFTNDPDCESGLHRAALLEQKLAAGTKHKWTPCLWALLCSQFAWEAFEVGAEMWPNTYGIYVTLFFLSLRQRWFVFFFFFFFPCCCCCLCRPHFPQLNGTAGAHLSWLSYCGNSGG